MLDPNELFLYLHSLFVIPLALNVRPQVGVGRFSIKLFEFGLHFFRSDKLWLDDNPRKVAPASVVQLLV